MFDRKSSSWLIFWRFDVSSIFIAKIFRAIAHSMICFFTSIATFSVFYLALFIDEEVIELFEDVVSNKLDVKITIICIIFISFSSIEVAFSISISIRIISFAIFASARIITLLFIEKFLFDFILFNIFFLLVFLFNLSFFSKFIIWSIKFFMFSFADCFNIFLL